MKRKSSYLRMEESRNRRLWITSVVLPTTMMLTTLYTGAPKFREFVDNKILDVHNAYEMKKAELKQKSEERKAKKATQ